MYLLIIILTKEGILEDVLSALIELGITDASILESQALGKVLAYKVPIFAGLRFGMEGGRPYSKTILALVEDKEADRKIAQLLKEVEIDLEEPGTGLIATVKVESFVGRLGEVEI